MYTRKPFLLVLAAWLLVGGAASAHPVGPQHGSARGQPPPARAPDVFSSTPASSDPVPDKRDPTLHAHAIRAGELPTEPSFDIDYYHIGTHTDILFTFVVLADIHKGTERLRSMVDYVNNELSGDYYNVKVVLVLGDFTSHGDDSYFATAKVELDQLNYPYAPVIGNHDVRTVSAEEEWHDVFSPAIRKLRDTFWGGASWARHGAPVSNPEYGGDSWFQNYAFDVEEEDQRYHFVCLDFCSRTERGMGGADLHNFAHYSGQGTYPWMKSHLSFYLGQYPGMVNQDRILFFSHHPPAYFLPGFQDIFYRVSFDGFEYQELIGSLSHEYGNAIGHWFAGHYHIADTFRVLITHAHFSGVFWIPFHPHNLSGGILCGAVAGSLAGDGRIRVGIVHGRRGDDGGNGGNGDVDGCPWLYGWNGSQFVEENTILPASVSDSLFRTDYYMLTNGTQSASGQYRLRIRESEQSRTFLEWANLIAIDHPAGTDVTITVDGRLLAYDGVVMPASCVDKYGGDCLPLIIGEDGEYCTLAAGDWLDVTFGEVEAGGSVEILMPPKCNFHPWYDIEVLEPPLRRGGGGETIDILYPRGRPSAGVVDVSAYNAGGDFGLRIRSNRDNGGIDCVKFLQPVAIDSVQTASLSTEAAALYALPAPYCASQLLGSATDELQAVDDAMIAELRPGEYLELAFPAHEEPEAGWVRDFVLATTGAYVLDAAGKCDRRWMMFQQDPARTGLSPLWGDMETVSSLWGYPTGGAIYSSPAIGDVNGDGTPEIVVGSDDGNVYVLDGRGCPIWSYRTGGYVQSSPALADLDCDGTLEILISSNDANLYALRGDGRSAMWSFHTGGAVYSSPVAADIDEDGVLEIIFGSFDHNLYVVDGGTGSLRWSYPTSGEIYASPAVGDIDSDGEEDVVVFSCDGRVYAIGGDGSTKWSRQVDGVTGERPQSSPALADTDGDGGLEVIVGSYDYNVYALDGVSGDVVWTYQTGGVVLSSPAVGDIDGDGTLEVVVGSSDGNIYALRGATGEPVWSYAAQDGIGTSSPALGDIDGDAKLEVVIGSRDYNLYALNGEDGSELWRYSTQGEIHASPALDDIDGDGRVEVVIASCDYSIYTLNAGVRSEPERVMADKADGSFLGEHAGDGSGGYVIPGDLDGDGFDDLIISAADSDEYQPDAGKVYIIFGSASGWSMDVPLSGAPVSLFGCTEGEQAGTSVYGLGDVNGDGYDDVAVGAPGWGADNRGKVYVVLGRSRGAWLGVGQNAYLCQVEYASFCGEEPQDEAGCNPIHGILDADGDGLHDILVTSARNDYGGETAGQLYLILADNPDLGSNMQVSLADASFYGRADDWASVSAALIDLDADGYVDLLVGAEGNSDVQAHGGKVYVVPGPIPYGDGSAALDRYFLPDWCGASFVGERSDDRAGWVWLGGDVNGDGFDDVLISSQTNGYGGAEAGQSYLVFGKSDFFETGALHDLSLAESDASFVGENNGDRSGSDCASGDIDGDGYGDIIVGAPRNDYDALPMRGQVYVVFGKPDGWAMRTPLGCSDISVYGEAYHDYCGALVDAGGDLNADGRDDLVVGSYGNDESADAAGQTYIFLLENKGACCYPYPYDSDHPCFDGVAQETCETNGGIYHGDDTVCGVRGACCAVGWCEELAAICCTESGATIIPGVPVCAGDVNGNGVVDVCEDDVIPIPTVSGWGLIVMCLLLLTGLKIKFGRRRPARA